MNFEPSPKRLPNTWTSANQKAAQSSNEQGGFLVPKNRGSMISPCEIPWRERCRVYRIREKASPIRGDRARGFQAHAREGVVTSGEVRVSPHDTDKLIKSWGFRSLQHPLRAWEIMISKRNLHCELPKNMIRFKCMITQTAERKISKLEQDLYQLKTEFYLARKRRTKPLSRYAETALLRVAKDARKDIWFTRYAKRAKSVS